MPGPSSATVMTNSPSVRRRDASVIVVDGGAYATAFSTRLRSASCSLAVSTCEGACRRPDLGDDALALRLQGPFEFGHDIGKQRLDVRLRRLDRLLSRLEARQAQQVAHEPLHAVRLPRDDLEEARGLLRLRRHVVLQRLDVALDRGQRRAQLVRHVGHEVASHAIGVAQVRDVVQDEHGSRRALGR